MARQRKINFVEAKEQGTILRGLVKAANVGNSSEEGNQLIVDCNGNKIIIPGEEVLPLPFNQAISAFVGSEIDFIITDVVEEVNLIFASNALAEEKKRKPILDKLYAGEVVDGVICYIVAHGAYIDMNGVSGLLKNTDFSDDGTAVSDVYEELQHIKVKFLKTSANGNIILEPETKVKGADILSFEDFTRGQIVMGKAVTIYPDKVYVRIAPGLDCLCPFPKNISHLSEQEKVKVKITKIFPENGRVRGAILASLEQ